MPASASASPSPFTCWVMMVLAGVQSVGLFLLPISLVHRVIGLLLALGMMISMPIWWKRANEKTEALFLAINLLLAFWIYGGCQYDPYILAVSGPGLALLLLDGAVLFFLPWARAFPLWSIRMPAATAGLAYAGLMVITITEIVDGEFRSPPLFTELGESGLDKDLGYDVGGYARQRNYFPSDPRGYFSRFDRDRLNAWHLWQLRRELDRPEPRALQYFGSGQVRIDPGIKTRKDSYVEFSHRHWLAEPFCDHVMRFRIRSDQPADGVLTTHALDPHRELERRPLRLTPAWQVVEIRPDRVDRPTKLNVVIDLAMTRTPIELDSLEVFRNGEEDRRLELMTPFSVEYQLNRHGLRGKDLAIPKPKGIQRIACLGDSFTFGQGVHEGDTYTAVLERSLNQTSSGDRGDVFEVLNAGRCGFSTYEERRIFDRYVAAYEPDLVILQMNDNDIENHTNLIGTPEPRTYPLLVEQAIALKERVASTGGKFAILLFRVAPLNDRWAELRRVLATRMADTIVVDVGPRVEPHLVLGGEGYYSFCVHPIDGHPNEKGHRFAAEALKEAINEHRLLQLASE